MIIKITKGEIEIKDIYTRKTKKEYNKILGSEMTMNTGQDGNAGISGLSIGAVDKANDALLLNMVTKITIGDENKEIILSVFDEMLSSDIDVILEKISELEKLQSGTKKK